ncbi:MAG: hypothetical protein KDC98_04180 [Planctomycetes bacterium]|nr:hypothetical protein [Planctomycetota bacterium]
MPILILAFALLALAAPAAAQAKLPKWKIDPYTKNDPKLIAAAGYVSLGPFRFGNIADNPTQSTQIDEALEYVQILWIETPHFRLGCNLPAWAVPTDLPSRNKIRAELSELKEKLPGINPKTRKLDPWLRAHLFAHRLEKLYAEISELFGVKDSDFPADPSKVIRTEGARYMGYGPFLGMRDKYLVLLFEDIATYRQYLKTFTGRDTKFPQRWHFKESSSLLFATAINCDGQDFRHDTAMHCTIGFNVSQLLLDGFRYYSYDLPVWIREGLAHWMLRRVSPRWPNFDQQEGGAADLRQGGSEKWPVMARNLVSSNGKFAPFPEVMKWRDFGDITYNDHVAVWSRFDWLMSQGPEKWQKFLFTVKGRVDANWSPDQSDLVGATRTGLSDAYGLTPLNFDDRWAEWVKATYPAK